MVLLPGVCCSLCQVGSPPDTPRWELAVLLGRYPHVIASMKVRGGGGRDNVVPAVGSVPEATGLASSELVAQRWPSAATE